LKQSPPSPPARASADVASAPKVAPIAKPGKHDALEAAIEKIQQSIGSTGQQVSFSVDDSSGQTVLRVIDAQTNTVLRQIPGDEALALARTLDRMQGMLIRQKA